ncbi:MAG: hypothetical protein JW715_02460 [Sedimentisphaerales bacterium]|nr:hypothetical protein [Sedimentisphaerales bacterium]
MIIIGSGLLIAGSNRAESTADINDIAESYVKLVLEIGLYDSEYADIYFGPTQWRPSDENILDEFPAELLGCRAQELIDKLDKAAKTSQSPEQSARCNFLGKQLTAVKGKIDLLAGKEMPFDEESRILYDVVAPAFEKERFDKILKELDESLPGEGNLNKRFENYNRKFLIPKDKLEAFFETAISEYRKRTARHIKLPPREKLEIDFSGFKSWAAELRYKGDYSSVIEIGSNMPFYLIDAAMLIRHEGYPGHHVHLSMIERHLYKEKNWVEYSVLPLNSPLAFLAEGIAEFGCRDLLGPTAENMEFERDVLFPLAGFDPAEAEKYFRIMELKDELDGAMVEAARQYLDGKMDAKQTRDWLEKYCLVTFAGADSLMRFIDHYRSYVVNYAFGRDMIKNYINNRCQTDNTPDKRWEIFGQLLTTPLTPSDLIEAGKSGN